MVDEAKPEVAEAEQPDPAADLLGGPVAEEVEEISLDLVRHRLSETIRAVGAPAVKQILADHQAKRLTELDPGTYASVVDVCEEMIQNAAAKEAE